MVNQNELENGIEQDNTVNGIFFPDAPVPQLDEEETSKESVTQESDPTDSNTKSLIENLQYQTLPNGSVQYKADNHQVYFTDHGRFIELDKSVDMDRDAIIAVLKLAQEKFGGKIELTGSQEFKEQAIRIMLEENLKITLSNPEQFALKEQMIKQKSQINDQAAFKYPESSPNEFLAFLNKLENDFLKENGLVLPDPGLDPYVTIENQDRKSLLLLDLENNTFFIKDPTNQSDLYSFDISQAGWQEKAMNAIKGCILIEHNNQADPDDVDYWDSRMDKEDEQIIGQLALIRDSELSEELYDGPFDAQHIKNVHQYLFQDTNRYKPGEIRTEAETWVGHRELKSTVNGADKYLVHYAPSSQIDTRLNEVFAKFDIEQLKKMNQQEAAKALATLYADLDFIHPFYEGNSRSIRMVTQQIAQRAGYTIDWGQTNLTSQSRDVLYVARDREVLRRAFDSQIIYSEKDLKQASRTIHNFQSEKSLEQIMKDVVISTVELKQRLADQPPAQKNEQYDSGYQDKTTDIDRDMMEFLIEKEIKKTTKVDRPVATVIMAPPGEYREALKDRAASDQQGNLVYANHSTFKNSAYYPVVKEHPAAWAKAMVTESMASKRNIAFHGNYHDPQNLELAIRKLKQAGYRVEIKAMPVHHMASALQEQTQTIQVWAPPFTNEQLSERLNNLNSTIQHLQSVKGLVDTVEIIDSDLKTKALSEYDAERDSWSKQQAVIAEVINQLHHRPLTDQEMLGIENKIDGAIAQARISHSPQAGNTITALQHLRQDVESIQNNQDIQKSQYKPADSNRPRPA